MYPLWLRFAVKLASHAAPTDPLSGAVSYCRSMSLASPTADGFRAAFRRPSLTLAEIAWRWSVGAVATALSLFAFVEFLDTLPVTQGDAVLLRSRQPVLIGRAFAHILHGSLKRAAITALCAAMALLLLWIVAASAGRAATVRALLDYFRGNTSGETSLNFPNQASAFRSLLALHFFRVAAALAALLAAGGSAILASLVSFGSEPEPGLFVILFLPLAGLIALVWSTLNWWLSLAGVFAVRDGEDALGAISAAVIFFREHAGSVVAVGIWNGLARMTVVTGASTAASLLLVFIDLAPARFLIASELLIVLVYFAVADWLYIARLAGYICIAEMPEALSSPASSPEPPLGQEFVSSGPVETAIDRDESILSDLPTLALET